MTISEKSAYLKGLAEGMQLDTAKPEGRLITELVSLVSDLCGTIELLEEQNTALEDYVEELDADLGDIEELLYECEDDCDCDCGEDDEYEYGEYDDEDCDGDCEDCCGCGDVMSGKRMLMCEGCGETICYDETLDPAGLTCPACGKPVSGETEEQ